MRHNSVFKLSDNVTHRMCLILRMTWLKGQSQRSRIQALPVLAAIRNAAVSIMCFSRAKVASKETTINMKKLYIGWHWRHLSVVMLSTPSCRATESSVHSVLGISRADAHRLKYVNISLSISAWQPANYHLPIIVPQGPHYTTKMMPSKKLPPNMAAASLR